MGEKMPWRGPADDAVNFWRHEADRSQGALDRARSDTAHLEHHYRLALQEIKRLNALPLGVDERIKLLGSLEHARSALVALIPLVESLPEGASMVGLIREALVLSEPPQ